MAAPTDLTVTYAGWVYKEGSLVKNWKKRFLVVKRRELAYYKTTDHTSQRAQLMGAMRVHRVERARGITNGLIVKSLEGRQLKFFMDTASECDKCFNAIAEWCHAGGIPPHAMPAARSPVGSTNRSTASGERSSLHSSSHASIGASATVSSERLAGWLEKQGQTIPTWKRRYFVMEGGVLSYAAHETGPHLARHRVLGVRRDRTRPFTMALTLDTGRELRVSGTDEHEISDWQRVIRQTLSASPSHYRSSGGGGEDLRQTLTANDASKASWQNLFGADPNDEDLGSPRQSTVDEYSFGPNIRLDFDGENHSFMECQDDGEPVQPDQPKIKFYSPKAPGPDSIRKMRIEQHLMDDDDDDDDITITRVSSSQRTSGGGSSPVRSRRPKNKPKNGEKPQGLLGPCCCIIM